MRMVCLGDSVTRGVSYIRGRLRIVKNNYPSLLYSEMMNTYPMEVINKGVFNDNSDGLVNRLEKDVIQSDADVVLVEIGGNDCNFRWDEVALKPDSEHAAIVPLERYLSNLTTMVETCRKAEIIPVFLTILPLDPIRYYKHIFNQYGPSIAHWISLCGGIEHWHGMYNRALKQLVQYLNILSVDVRTGFKRAGNLENLLSEDGVHPTEAGYQVLSQLVAQEMRAVLTGHLIKSRVSQTEVH